MCLSFTHVFEQQLDYDSRVLQRRLYQEALQEITLPSLVSRMDSKYKTVRDTHHRKAPDFTTLIAHILKSKYLFVQELEQFEQYIFSDYSSFILVHNVYDDVLRNILVREVTTGKDTH